MLGQRAGDVPRQPEVPPEVDMHIEVSKVHITGSHASVPPLRPRLMQVKPCRSAPSHCSPGLIAPSPQPAASVSLVGPDVPMLGSSVVASAVSLLEVALLLSCVVAGAVVVSSPELDALCSVAREHGALGAKLTGAGGGGVMIALVDSGAEARVAAAIRAAGGTPLLADVAVPGAKVVTS